MPVGIVRYIPSVKSHRTTKEIKNCNKVQITVIARAQPVVEASAAEAYVVDSPLPAAHAQLAWLPRSVAGVR